MANETDPYTMAGRGEYETISVRGIGFAPKKTQELLPPITKPKHEKAIKKISAAAVEDLTD
jgi:hypothetical protein